MNESAQPVNLLHCCCKKEESVIMSKKEAVP